MNVTSKQSNGNPKEEFLKHTRNCPECIQAVLNFHKLCPTAYSLSPFSKNEGSAK